MLDIMLGKITYFFEEILDDNSDKSNYKNLIN